MNAPTAVYGTALRLAPYTNTRTIEVESDDDTYEIPVEIDGICNHAGATEEEVMDFDLWGNWGTGDIEFIDRNLYASVCTHCNSVQNVEGEWS